MVHDFLCKSRLLLTKPCLLAVYAIPPAAPLTPALLLILTMHPCFLAFMNGNTSRIILMGVVKLTEITWSHSRSVMVSAEEKLSIMPATLARTSIRSLLWSSEKPGIEDNISCDSRTNGWTRNSTHPNSAIQILTPVSHSPGFVRSPKWKWNFPWNRPPFRLFKSL